MRIPILLLACFLFCSSLHAQNVTTKHLKCERLTIDDGLSQGLVNCMLQDRYGFMWFGTKDGLNRYDGYQFTIFRHDTRDERSISGNFIQYLFEDSYGRLWVGTLNNGLDLFERETETFIHFTHSDTVNAQSTSINNQYQLSGLSAQMIWGITEDWEGNIWVATSAGVDVITINNNVEDIRQKYSIINTNIRRLVYGITSTADRKIYLRAHWYKLYRIRKDNRALDFHNLQLDTITSASFDFSSVTEKVNYLFSWFMVRDTFHNQTWFFEGSSFVCVDDRNNKVLKVRRVANRQINVRSAVIDSNGVMLFLADYELKELNTQTGLVTNIDFDNFNVNKINRGFFSVLRDRSGTLWLATNGYGLVKHDIDAEKFHHTGELSVAYFGPAPNSYVEVIIYPMSFIFDPHQGAFIDSTWLYLGGQSFGNGYNSTMFPTIDDSKHRRLIGYSNRLYCYDYETGSGVEYQLPLSVTGDLAEFSEVQQHILEDHSGFIWIATRDGLFRFDENKHSWKRFTNVEGDTTSISTDIIFSLCLDPKEPEKYLWIGTDGGGLNRMDMTTAKFISFTTHDGLPNNVVYGVLPDDEGNLWLSTNKGLSCFNPLKRTFKNYEEKDGLQSNEFNHRAFYRSPNGMLFFGGVNGFNYFNPKEILDNTYIPEVYITNVRIRNEPVSFKKKNALLQAPAWLAKEITLPYSQNIITFEFASMDFSRAGKNLFQYKLDGFDHDWVQSGTNHSATYTNLDPGTYTFLLKGSNSDGVWNEKPTSMQLTILPPWYMTWWFRVAVVIAICSLLYALYRYRLQQALKLQSVRNRIAQDLHDEIGSNLSNISIFSDLAQTKMMREPTEATSLMQLVNDYTQDSMEAMSDIVWMINSKNDRFENILVRMQFLAGELFEAKNFRLHFFSGENLNSVKLGMEERKNFYLIYKEALNNIAKYAECNNVWIDLNYQHGEVVMNIRDDGKGFDMNTRSHGNGLINMHKRATLLNGKFQMESFVGKGTSIKLSFKA